MTAVPLPPPLPAAARILDAGLALAVRGGATAVSLQEVATHAGVSKGLIHYHFHDKATLVARLVEHAAARVVAREREAAARAAAAPAAQALDVYWRWLETELARGELRAGAELAGDPAEHVRAAARHASGLRHGAAAATLDALFGTLALRPRVPAPMLAAVLVSFVDGLAVSAAANRRVAYDVFWLAVLGLAE
ncbi:MAG: TetR/AcrR family transcriptional regulator [Gemmatimonadaceae bacterium]